MAESGKLYRMIKGVRGHYGYLLASLLMIFAIYPFVHKGSWVNYMLEAAFLATIVACLLVSLGKKSLGRGPAIAAGVGAALYGPFIFFEGEYLAPVLSVFLNLLLLITLVRIRCAPRLLARSQWNRTLRRLVLTMMRWEPLFSKAKWKACRPRSSHWKQSLHCRMFRAWWIVCESNRHR